jgi:hypothetical protein
MKLVIFPEPGVFQKINVGEGGGEANSTKNRTKPSFWFYYHLSRPIIAAEVVY